MLPIREEKASALSTAIEKAEAEYMSSLTPKNSISFTTDDFSATVRMNPRDAMVFATIEKLPEDQEARIAALKEFKACLHNDFGGKTFLELDPKYYQDAIAAGFKATASSANGPFTGAKFMDAKTAESAMSAIKDKADIKTWLARFAENKEYQFTRLHKDNAPGNKELYEKLFQFKKEHAGFVNPDKEKQGLYSAKAEKLKITNEFVDEFVVTKNGEVVGTMMIARHGNMTYFADYIVHKDERSAHLAQAIAYKVYQELQTLYPSAFKGIWYIAGGDGDKPLGKHLYGTIFPSKTIDEEVQREQGFLVYLTNPGKILCKAANRSLTAPFHSLDNLQADVGLHAFVAAKEVVADVVLDKDKRAVM